MDETTRHEQIACARRHVSEDADRDAQVAVLARDRIERGEQRTARRARRHEVTNDALVAAEEFRGRPSRRLRAILHGAMRAADQHVGDAGQRRRHDHERIPMRGDERDRPFDGPRVGERRAAELPHLQPSARADAGVRLHA